MATNDYCGLVLAVRICIGLSGVELVMRLSIRWPYWPRNGAFCPTIVVEIHGLHDCHISLTSDLQHIRQHSYAAEFDGHLQKY